MRIEQPTICTRLIGDIIMKSQKYLRLLFIALLTVLSVSLTCISCKSRSDRKSSSKELNSAVADSLVLYLKSLNPKGDTIFLSTMEYTSMEYRNSMTQFIDDTTFISNDPTKYSDALFKAEPDIRVNKYVQDVCQAHNLVTIYDFLLDAYYLSCAMAENPDSLSAGDLVSVSDARSLIGPGISDPKIKKIAYEMYNAYNRIDGDTTSLKRFFDVTYKLQEASQQLPRAATPQMIEEFRNKFKEWYSISLSCPEADTVSHMRYRLQDEKKKLPYDYADRLVSMAWAEKDIERRTALALECINWNEEEGLDLLGDIMESGIYTRRLIEVWYTWRAYCQTESFSLSSNGFIPNRYYSRMKVKCINTLLRHIQETDDTMAKCLLDELIMYQTLQRQGSLFGNESLEMVVDLNNSGFLPYHYLSSF